MAQASQTKEDDQSIEYSIVAFYHPKLKKDTESELVDTITDMDAAFRQADKLSGSGDYYKVEVKKKYIEPKTGREIDMVLKVFEYRQKKPLSLGVILAMTLLAGGIAFGLAFYLGQSMKPQTAQTPVSGSSSKS